MMNCKKTNHKETMKKYIITGGADFIGGHIAETLFRQGLEVIVMKGLEETIEDYHNQLLIKQ